jgi:anti-sigma factor RsiW
MTHAEIEKLLPAYADSQLDEPQRSEVAAAVAASPQLQAAVARWQALRQLAHRHHAAITLPPGFEDRIRHQLAQEAAPRSAASANATSRRDRGTILKLGLAVTAAAAAVLIAVFTWSPEPAPVFGGPVVAVDTLWQEHVHCIEMRADAYHVRGMAPAEARRVLAGEVDMPFVLPDLTELGWELYGANPCRLRANGQQIALTHVMYRSTSDPQKFASFFTFREIIQLPPDTPLKRVAGPPRCGGDGPWLVETPQFAVVTWIDAAHSVAACGPMEGAELQQLVAQLGQEAERAESGAEI